MYNITTLVILSFFYIQKVEDQFAYKLGNMETYDSFMDYNVALLTINLVKYASNFDNDGTRA